MSATLSIYGIRNTEKIKKAKQIIEACNDLNTYCPVEIFTIAEETVKLPITVDKECNNIINIKDIPKDVEQIIISYS